MDGYHAAALWKGEQVKEELINKMRKISPEEQSYLDGNPDIRRELYSHRNLSEIDRALFLSEGRLVAVRPHSRFVEFPEHRHNYIEMMYICSGTITHCMNQKELVMEKGDLLLLNQQVRHSVKKAGYDDIGVNFIALPEFFDIPLGMLRKGNVLADFLVDTLRQNGQQPQYLLKHLDRLTKSSSQSYQDIVLQSILKYIDTSFQNASLTKIAEDFHQSLPVLSKMIRQSTGVTFQELLQRKKFQKAVMLLLETNLPVEEIAAAVGYENQSYFHRQFKARYGMTPAKYRREHREDAQIRL